MLKRLLIVSAIIGGLVPLASAQLSDADKAFVKKTAHANNLEIQSGQLALATSQNDADKAYAQMMVGDHTKAGEKLTAAVQGADPSVQLPTDLSPKGKAELDVLKHSGHKFDKEFRKQMIADHEKVQQLFQEYVQRPDANPAVKQVIQNLQPKIAKHLADAQNLPQQ